jgi:hypothetical protein
MRQSASNIRIVIIVRILLAFARGQQMLDKVIRVQTFLRGMITMGIAFLRAKDPMKMHRKVLMTT